MNKTSKGEQKIINLLRRGGLKFEREVSFDDLTGKKKVPLRFDFKIWINGKYVLCEVDGQQHFQFTPYFHKTRSKFMRQQEWDRRKNKYCLMHNIILIRIPYWELEDLTLKKIFAPEHIVTNVYHNDFLRKQHEVK